MKRIFLIIIVPIFLVFIFSSCEYESSDSVEQDRIYVLYEMIYDKAEDVSYARASFFFGSITGTKLELASPSSVTCNNEALGFKSELAYYEKQFVGFVPEGNFVWTDLDGNEFHNTANIKTIELPQILDTIVKGESYELTWIGEPLGDDETVWVYIDGDMENDEVSAYQTTANATKIIITATQTDKLSVGENDIVINRRNNTAAQEVTSAGAKCAGVYKSEKVKIQVNE